jgi:hypothetical protein
MCVWVTDVKLTQMCPWAYLFTSKVLAVVEMSADIIQELLRDSDSEKDSM